MTFAGTVPVHQSLPAWRRLARTGVALAAATVLLAACGGGDQVKRFQPTSTGTGPAMMSFGDENSALVEVPVGGSGSVTTIKGFKYGVNSVEWAVSTIANDPVQGSRTLVTPQPAWVPFPTSGEVANTLEVSLLSGNSFRVREDYLLNTLYTDSSSGLQTAQYYYTYYCTDYPLWIQSLARSYGLGYQQQCPSESAGGAVTYAAAGATVADTAAQVASHRGEIGSNTLVTIMAGQHDILAAYKDVRDNGKDFNVAKNEMTAKGKELAAVVNEVYDRGAHVLFVRLHNLGFSPLARADGSTGQDRMRELTLAFNTGLLINVRNDGIRVGLVNFYDRSFELERYPSYAGVTDISSSVCSATVYKPDGSVVAPAPAGVPGGDPLLYCSTLTVDRAADRYFWSDSFNLAPRGQAYLAQWAYRRAFDEVF
jgi:hypothetical protein